MKKLLIIGAVLISPSVMAAYATCNSFGNTEICRDSNGYSSTTHYIGNTYITNGSDGYRSTTYQIGDSLYQGHDNRGNNWNIIDSDNRPRY